MAASSPTPLTRADLRRLAVGRSLVAADDIAAAVRRLGYLQADPIRAPARAQDLILRQRVPSYRAEELERRYPSLPLFEDMLHNYGFFPVEHMALLHPRALSARWRQFLDEHVPLKRKVLRYLDENPEAHPREVERVLGTGPRVNGWGGTSSATTLILEALHREGRLRVARRDGGMRVYASAAVRDRALPPRARADGLLRLLINLYAPLPQRTLMQLVRMMGSYKPQIDYTARIETMVKRGALRRETIEGLIYLWPVDEVFPDAVEERVRFLAPFDPVVWDRLRFEHLWGWPYRFEAYVPPAKRKMGYYALPLLWRDQVIGWANADWNEGKLRIETGFAMKKPPRADAAVFRRELDAEIERLRAFLIS